MDKLFLVELSGGNIRHCELELPATDYELLDALDKLRISAADKLRFDICDYYGYNYLAPFISDALNIYELNALSRKLADLNPVQQTAFAGLLKMEIEKRDGDILVPKLIDLAYSADCCHVVAEALNDSQLGRFYADNGFIPITENVPDSVYESMNCWTLKPWAEKHAMRRAAYSWSETPTVAVAMLSVTKTWWRRTRIWI